MISCPMCGKQNKDRAKFCDKCGAGLMLDPLEHQAKVEGFIHLLTSTDPEMKRTAVKSLGELEDETALEPLINTLESEQDWQSRKELVLALKNFKEEDIIKVFVKTFNKEISPEVRASIINIVGDFRSREATNLLICALGDQFADIQQQAITALGNIKDRKALEPLFDILKDERSLFREDARLSIEKIDPDFLKLWKEEEETKKTKISQRKNIPVIISIVLFVVLVIVAFKIYMDINSKKMLEAKLNEGKKCLSVGDYQTAQRLFKEVIYVVPEDPRGNYGLGMAYLNVNENKKALEVLQKAAKRDEVNPDYRVGLGRALMANENYPEAIIQLKKAIELKKNLSEAYIALGEVYYKSKDNAKALEVFNYCLETFPQTAAYTDADGWIKKINNSSSAPPSDISSKYAAGNDYLKGKDYDKALQTFDEILSTNPKEPDAYFGKGMAYYGKRDLDKAKKEFEQVISIAPAFNGPYLALGQIYLDQNDFPRAIDSASRLLNIDPRNSMGYLLRGQAYYNSGNKRSALDDLKKYIELSPDAENASEVKNWIQKIEKEI